MPQITPLVSNSLGGGHIDRQTDTHTHTYRRPHQSDFKKPGVRPACAWFKKLKNQKASRDCSSATKSKGTRIKILG